MLQDELVLANDMQVEAYSRNGGYPTDAYLAQRDANRVFIRFTVEVNDSAALGDTTCRLFVSQSGIPSLVFSFSKFNPTVELRRELHGSLVGEIYSLTIVGAGSLGSVGVQIGRLPDRNLL